MDSVIEQGVRTRRADPRCASCFALDCAELVPELHELEDRLRHEIDVLEKRLTDQGWANKRLSDEIDDLKEKIREIMKERPAGGGVKKAVPSFVKASTRKEGKRHPGSKAGHEGVTRETPERIDETVVVRASRCPDCGGKRLKRLSETSGHTQEDFRPGYRWVRRFERQVYWCESCCKRVYPGHAEEVEDSYLGPEVIATAAALKYESRLPLERVREVLRTSYGMEVSASGLSQALSRLADRFAPAYDGLTERVRVSRVVQADETGWREDGRNGWLWNFSNRDVSVSRIDPSRSKDVVREVLGLKLSDVLVSDFYGAYHEIEAVKQKCLVHVKRNLREAMEKAPSVALKRFEAAFERWLTAALTLKAEKARLSKRAFQDRRAALERSLNRLSRTTLPADSPAAPLPARLGRHRNELLTFLDHEGVEYHNHHAERQIRSHAVIRKISYGTKSPRGSRTYQVLMSVMQTCKLQGTNFRNVCKGMLLNPRAGAYTQLTWIFGRVPTKTFVKALKRLAKEGPFDPLLAKNIIKRREQERLHGVPPP